MSDFNALFNLEPEIAYLNHAAVSPWPRCTSEAVAQFAAENATRGAADYPRWMQVERELKERLATLINASSVREIALSKSTSEALSIIAYGLNWNTNDEVLVCNQEFPSNRIVWESLDRYGVSTKVVPVENLDPAQSLINASSSSTKLISVSSVQYASGIRTDLYKLSKHCKANNILLCVDAIQSLGAFPFDQQEVQADFIVADGHKWLMAAEGLALLYVREDRLEELTLRQFGWHMVADRGNYLRNDWKPASDASRFECGSPNMLGIHALHASTGLLLNIGMDVIAEAVESRVALLIKQLKEIPDLRLLSPEIPELRAGIVTFTVPSIAPEVLYKKLMAQQVICACRGGGVRFSPHFYTSNETIEQAVNRVKALSE